MSTRRLLLYSAVGLGAGLCNGLLGSGGGIVLFFALSLLGYGNAKDRFAMNVAVICAISTVSCFLYWRQGHVNLPELTPYILPAAAGGIAGALLVDRINTVWLKRIFAVLVIYAGWRMLR